MANDPRALARGTRALVEVWRKYDADLPAFEDMTGHAQAVLMEAFAKGVEATGTE